MDDTKTRGFNIALSKSRTLFLLTADTSIIPAVTKHVRGLLEWLGVPDTFKVYLWWRDDPRMLEVEDFPNRRNVNGGWAYANSDEIFIYRAEEYDRVLIHETIHAMGWDWDMPSEPLACWGLNKNSTVSPHLFEAWTELLAEWLWCAWNRKDWSRQRTHQEEQAIQILARESAIWNENTNVFAYYVLKAALAPHVEFLWTFSNGVTKEERLRVLCSLVDPELVRLRKEARGVRPKRIPLRMTAE